MKRWRTVKTNKESDVHTHEVQCPCCSFIAVYTQVIPEKCQICDIPLLPPSYDIRKESIQRER